MSTFRKIELLPDEDEIKADCYEDAVVCRCCNSKMECMVPKEDFENMNDKDCKNRISVINGLLSKLGLEMI
ncbi:hypothetical protein [Methanosarcina mazei]|uniref:hypothetical protein n=1 Tax=Methanosarcina mazei TaxID=2209 RepID=UPI00064E98B6|nr:hypothetical protein [Methanosarcina mazei]